MFDYSDLESLKKKQISAPWPKGLLIFFAFLFLLVLGFNFLLRFYLLNQEKQLKSLNDQLKNLRASISREQEKDILQLEKKINKLDSLLANHIYFSSFFDWLEKYTHPGIYYSNLDYSSDNLKVSLSGFAKDNQSLIEGVETSMMNKMINSTQLVEGLILKNLENEANVKFSLDIYLKLSGLLFKPENNPNLNNLNY
jgi:hypothetical protein